MSRPPASQEWQQSLALLAAMLEVLVTLQDEVASMDAKLASFSAVEILYSTWVPLVRLRPLHEHGYHVGWDGWRFGFCWLLLLLLECCLKPSAL